MSELGNRLLVAVIGIPLVFALIWAGGVFFFLLIALISAMAQYEFYKLIEQKGNKPLVLWGITAGILILFATNWSSSAWFTMLPLLMLIILMTLTISIFFAEKESISAITSTLAGVFYVPLSLSTILFIMNDKYPEPFSADIFNSQQISNQYLSVEGFEFIVSILVAIWACDTAAFFLGKQFGRKKLFPRVSPKKTWFGAISGLFGAVICFVAIILIFDTSTLSHIPELVLLGMIIGISAQVGDLAESQLKRDAGVKDSSSILPGHGGILDRIDSILFVFPSVFIYLFFRGIW